MADCAAPALEVEAVVAIGDFGVGRTAVPTTGDRLLPPAFSGSPDLPSVDRDFLWPALEVERPLVDEELPPGAADAVADDDDSPKRCLAVARSEISYRRARPKAEIGDKGSISYGRA